MKLSTLRKLTVGALALFSLQPASAIILANGDFSTDGGTLAGGRNAFLDTDIDTGWVGTRSGWTITGGVATRVRDTANSQPLVQVAAVPAGLTGNQYVLNFDWTPPAGATGTALGLSVITSGIIQGTDPVVAGQSIFGGLNFATPQTRVFGGTGASNVDLIDGVTSGGNRNTTRSTTTGVAGATTNGQITLNFGTNNIEDFDFIAIRFEVADPTSIGGIIDNVSFQAIPEPSSALLLSLGSLAFLRRKR